MPHPDPEQVVARFRTVAAALAADGHGWEDPDWLRFAAQAVLAIPGEAAAAVAAVRRTAAGFRADAGWLHPLHSPLRHLVAALVVQAGGDAAGFEGELARVRPLLRRAGVARGGIYEVLAVLVLHVEGGRAPIAAEAIGRIAAIYRQLKLRHWWLTGPHDLPACALLATLPGSAEEVGRMVEHHHHLLAEDGVARGVALEQAAHILPLLRLPPRQAVHRYGALVRRFAAHGQPAGRDDCQAAAILAFLDRDAETEVGACLACYRRLEALHPQPRPEVLFDLSADLTTIAALLWRMDWPGLDHGQRAALARTLRDEQLAAAMVAAFVCNSVDPTVC